MRHLRVGVLGGMGPAATILLQQRLMEAVVVDDDNGHIPLLVDMNTQVPSRIEYLLHGRGDSPGPVLSKMARDLELSGADLLVMPCCTAHHFADEIEQATAIPFLHMLHLTVRELRRRVPKAAQIGVLASPATEKIGLFKKIFQAYGLNPVHACGADRVLEIIEGIKRDGVTDEHVRATQLETFELSHGGVDAIVLGCSEFSLVSPRLTSRLPIVDAMDALVSGIAAAANEQQLKRTG